MVGQIDELQSDKITTREDYVAWFKAVACDLMARLPAGAYAVFYQSDKRMDGLWLDKAHLLCQVRVDCRCLPRSRGWCRLVPWPGGAGGHAMGTRSHGCKANLHRSTLPQIGWRRGPRLGC